MSDNAAVVALFTAFAGIVLLSSLQTVSHSQSEKTTNIVPTQVVPSLQPTLTISPTLSPTTMQIPSIRHRINGVVEDDD